MVLFTTVMIILTNSSYSGLKIKIRLNLDVQKMLIQGLKNAVGGSQQKIVMGC